MWHSDLIEFELDNIENRTVKKINFYDVKSKLEHCRREYFEMCISTNEFMNNAQSIGCGAYIVSLIILNNWRLDFDVFKLCDVTVRVYDSSVKKTVFFSKNKYLS